VSCLTTANASQPVAAANPARKALYIENPTTAAEPLYVNFTGAASDSTSGTNSSISLAPGGSYVDPPGFVTTEAVNVTSATAGHQFVCKEA
jgi:hypothetical protein